MKVKTNGTQRETTVELEKDEALDIISRLSVQLAYNDNPTLELDMRETSDLRVLNMGLPKSGCHSVREAFTSMGYKVLHARHPDMGDSRNYVGMAMMKAIEDGVDPMAYLPSWAQVVSHLFAVFNDVGFVNPFDGGLIPAVLEAYPDVAIILPTRPLETQVDSMYKWFKADQDRPDLETMMIEAGVAREGHVREDLTEWIQQYWDYTIQTYSSYDRFATFNIYNPHEAVKELRRLGFNITKWPHENKYWRKK